MRVNKWGVVLLPLLFGACDLTEPSKEEEPKGFWVIGEIETYQKVLEKKSRQRFFYSDVLDSIVVSTQNPETQDWYKTQRKEFNYISGDKVVQYNYQLQNGKKVSLEHRKNYQFDDKGKVIMTALYENKLPSLDTTHLTLIYKIERLQNKLLYTHFENEIENREKIKLSVDSSFFEIRAGATSLNLKRRVEKDTIEYKGKEKGLVWDTKSYSEPLEIISTFQLEREGTPLFRTELRQEVLFIGRPLSGEYMKVDGVEYMERHYNYVAHPQQLDYVAWFELEQLVKANLITLPTLTNLEFNFTRLFNLTEE